MNKRITKIYENSPAFVKNAAISAYGYYLKKKRYGKRYEEFVNSERGNAKLTLAELEKIQLKKLKTLLQDANQYSPYYHKAFETAGVTDTDIRNATDAYQLLARLPYLEKADLRAHMSDIVSRDGKRKTVGVTFTSGSTGTPMAVEKDADASQYGFAVWRRFYDWMGLPESFKSVRFSGRIIISPSQDQPPFWVYNASTSQLFMSTYHLTEEHLESYIRKLNSFQPQLIDGYPSAITVIAKYIHRNNIKLAFTPTAIATTAETLTPENQRLIETAFRCPVYNQYASSEGAPFICQCREGQMHLWIDTGVFEFINKVPYNDELDLAELVVTSFRSLKTPLIRYRIGDTVLVYKDHRTCSCGCQYPIIHSVTGRVDDILFTREKGYVGRLDTAYKGVEGITESQIIQHDVDHIEVKIVKNKLYDESQENLLLKNLKDRLGTNVQYELHSVESIPRGANGKFRTVVREFKIEDNESR